MLVRAPSQNRSGNIGVMWCDGERAVVDLVRERVKLETR
jgi:hypothetical protein